MTLRRFRLARVLRTREVEEQAARSTYRAAESAAQIQELDAGRSRDQLHAGRTELGLELARNSLSPAQVLQRHWALDHLRSRALDARARAARSRIEADELRAHWHRCRMAVEGLTRLRDRTRQRWNLDDQRTENTLSDERALARAFQAHHLAGSSYAATLDDAVSSGSLGSGSRARV